MVDTTILNKLSLIYEFLKDNSLITLILLLLVVIVLDLLYGNNKRDTKILYIVVITLLILFICLMYYKPLMNVFDIYITNIIKITYFPNIIEYTTMILITIILQIISFKKKIGFIKHFNIWIALIIEVLFIINIIALNGINIDLNNVTSIYENDLLLSIFQVTGIIFMLWIIINILTFIVNIYLEDKIEMPKLSKDIYE